MSCLYLPRAEGGSGLISDEGAINTEDRNINVFISQSQEHLLKSFRKRKNVDEIETPKEHKERMKLVTSISTGHLKFHNIFVMSLASHRYNK